MSPELVGILGIIVLLILFGLRMQVGMYLRELAKGTPEQDVSTAFLSYRSDDLRPIVLERWRKYFAKLKVSDPVFGPWMQLSKLEAELDQKTLDFEVKVNKIAPNARSEFPGRDFRRGGYCWQ